ATAGRIASHSRRKNMHRMRSRAFRPLMAGAAAIFAIGLMAGCSSDAGESADGGNAGTTTEENAATGETVTIGWSGPEADHGWLGAINTGAINAAEGFDDVELVQAEGTNDVNQQIAAIEKFINDGVDAIVLLPSDGAALTQA